MKITLADALIMLAETEMKPFEKEDFYTFSGVESANPLIGVNVPVSIKQEVTIVLDGQMLGICCFEVDEKWDFCFDLQDKKPMGGDSRMEPKR